MEARLTLPDPLVSADVSLEAYPSFQLNTTKLMHSEFLALATGDEFKAAIKLWCSAWKQTPAASLPNNDKLLAVWSGLGEKWKDSRDMVLQGWVECSDGRLYHPELAEDAKRCWQSHLAYLEKKEKDKLRKGGGKHTGPEVLSDGIPLEADRKSAKPPLEVDDVSSVIPPLSNQVNTIQDSVLTNVRTDADASDDPVKILFDRGRELLASYKIPNRKAGELIGKWRKSGDQRLLEVLQMAETQRRADIVAFITGCLAEKKKPTVQGLGRNLQSMEGGPFSNENGEFHVSGWAQTLGIDAVAEQMLKAKSAGWDRAKTMAHLNSLAAGKTRENFASNVGKTKETTAMTPPAEDPNWSAVKTKLCTEYPKAKSFLPMIRSVDVNGTSVKVRASNRFAVGHIEENYATKLLELFKIQKPGIEKIEVML